MPETIHFTPAEHEALRALGRGEAPAVAARRMGLSESRYRLLIHRIQQKTGTRHPRELIPMFVRKGRR